MIPPSMFQTASIRLASLLALCTGHGASAADFSPDQLEFFEKKIRPVLAEHCYDCHGPKKQNNDLRLDSRAAILKGSSYGPVVVAGDAAASKLITAITHAKPDDIKPMPKGGEKLPDQAIADISEWIRQGLPWPTEAPPAGGAAASPSGPHWAFQPVVMPATPTVQAGNRVQQPLDAFVLAGLEKAGLAMNPPSDRATRLKRWTMDLLGLPATFEEIQAYVADAAPEAEAAAKQVDRLLASPHYGERLARHWLDVSRYADTKGYVFQEERRYAYAYTYRDWVIRSLNADMPYDDFLRQQLSADKQPGPQQKQNQAALGFLTLGRRFLNNTPDIIDDRMDVVFRGTQGLTVSCARCHDHKFDPIPTADYYSLYGVFASSQEPTELPELDAEMNTPEGKEFLEKLRALEGKVEDYLQGRLTKAQKAPLLEKALKIALDHANKKGDDLRRAARDVAVYKPFAEKAQLWLKNEALGGVLLAKLYSTPPAEWPKRLQTAENGPGGWLAREWKAKPPTTKEQLLAAAGKLLEEALAAKPRAELAELHAWLHKDGNIGQLVPGDIVPFLSRPEQDKHRELKTEVAALKASHPGSPPRAMVLQDKEKPEEPNIFIRGNSGRHGARVPRQFLAAISGPDRKAFTQGSGRVELADAIVSKSNPLTARVMVNRLWAWYFGAPLVDTPSDFGVRTAKPANPELLDYLAAKFMADGWSVKKLLREILLSSTYGQSSATQAAMVKADPENRLLWRAHRKRLTWEALRDSLLAASNGLDRQLFGRAVPMFEDQTSNRRTVYGFIDRQNLPNQLRTFDFASPDSHAPKRFETTVPQQALYMLNSPFLQARANELASGAAKAGGGMEGRIKKLFQATLSRNPSPEELSGAIAFLKVEEETPQDQPDGTWQFGYGFWDAEKKQTQFTHVATATKDGFTPTATFPDPTYGYLRVQGATGHPGNSPNQATVARWTCGTTANVDMKSLFKHYTAKGDGVRVRIVSSKAGLLQEWLIPAGQSQELRLPAREVTAGETWDFLVDPNTESSYDSYEWDPNIRELPTKRVVSHPGKTTAKAKPSLSPMAVLAQSLLCTNEFAFVD